MAADTGARDDRIASYLRQPYTRTIIPETDGTFQGEIMEFPGCIATGDTPAETFSALEDVACSWLEAALEHNQPIPEPVENTAFSWAVGSPTAQEPAQESCAICGARWRQSKSIHRNERGRACWYVRVFAK